MDGPAASAAASIWVVLPSPRPDHLGAVLSRSPGAFDTVVAVDGGAQTALDLGWSPTVLVGDLDSCPAHVVDDLEAQGVEVQRHPRDKDETDLELALRYIEPQRAATDGIAFVVVGGGGGRVDHLLANAAVLSASIGRPTHTTWVTADATTEILEGPAELVLFRPVGQTISFLAASEAVAGLHTTGLRWSLTDACLGRGTGHGMSNLVDGPVSIRFTSGVLSVITPHGAEADEVTVEHS